MASKRIKISFKNVNEGRFTVISSADISQSSNRIKTEMKGVVREHEKRQVLSQKEASKLVLNF